WKMARHQLVTGRWIDGKPYTGKAVATRRTTGSEAHPAIHAKLRNVFAARCRRKAPHQLFERAARCVCHCASVHFNRSSAPELRRCEPPSTTTISPLM